jgi:hypothetical protein
MNPLRVKVAQPLPRQAARGKEAGGIVGSEAQTAEGNVHEHAITLRRGKPPMESGKN